METLPQITDIHESLRHLFYADGEFDIRQADTVPALLPEGDALWIDQDTPRIEKSEAIGDNFFVIRIFDLHTGEQLNDGVKLGIEWWKQQMGDYDYAHFGRMFPNTYVVNEGHLFVSGGMWTTEDHPDEEGMGRFVSSFSVRAEEYRRRAEWLDYRADSVAAVQPAWARPDETWVDPDEGDTIEFVRTVGTVKIEQAFHVNGDNFTPDSDAEVRVIAGATDYGIFAGTEIMDVGMDLIRAGQILYGRGNVSVSIFEIVAKELGVSPGDVYLLGEQS
ncbi:hypothetical protein [Microbacterium sp. Leaf179]|uniref:hypothetical protein n=1 Tax=Microbacterium sp. Leaf179 TaxID=1736288 RepID=UPI0006FC44FF|nr:hypothetical protein [Microbacterium sp. Leaf179]KQR85193.1 hypothetical protein ASF96_14755 [Microbacterium sp. Leaf179]